MTISCGDSKQGAIMTLMSLRYQDAGITTYRANVDYRTLREPYNCGTLTEGETTITPGNDRRGITSKNRLPRGKKCPRRCKRSSRPTTCVRRNATTIGTRLPAGKFYRMIQSRAIAPASRP